MATEFELVPGHMVGGNNPVFIIAEAGQNHQGDIEIAKRLIIAAKEAGADCVKFQKTDLSRRFNKAALQREYISSNSFGKTYGEHRKHLEFSEDQFKSLKTFALENNIIFASSGMDDLSMEFLNLLELPFFKVGSGDSNNLQLIEQTCSYGKPVVISTGMQDIEMVDRIYETALALNSRLCLLQCTSSYPTAAEDVNLKVLRTYMERYPKAVIGYSGHEIGLEISIAAVALGAKVIERHLTLDKSLKGSDHPSSLLPTELKQLVSSIRRVEKAMGSGLKTRQKSEEICFRKLGKTVVATKNLKEGDVLHQDSVLLKVAEPPGCPGEKISEIILKKLIRDIKEDESIMLTDVFMN